MWTLWYLQYIFTGLDNTDENEQVVFILRPTSINVCSKDLLLDHLPKQSNKLYADGEHDYLKNNIILNFDLPLWENDH